MRVVTLFLSFSFSGIPSFLARPYSALPLPVRAAFTLAAFLSVFVYAFGLIRLVRQGRREAWLYLVLSAGAVSGFLLYETGARLAAPAQEAGEGARIGPGLFRLIAVLPAPTVALLCLTVAGGAVFSLYGVIQIQRTRITTMSVGESSESLPCGLCYFWEGGFPKLTNGVMEQISRALTGSSLENGELFWQTLSAPGEENAGNGDGAGAVFLRRGEEPVLRLGDGRVYAFRRRRLDFEGKPLYEIVAGDMTEEYARADALREKRERAEDTARRLRELGESIARLTVEREVLGMKIRIHDNLNRALLTAKRALAKPGDGTDGDGAGASCLEAARLWREKILSLDYLTKSEADDDYGELFRSAETLGARIEVLGGLPRTSPLRELGALAVEVGLSNMLKHTDGSLLTVDCTEPGRIVITNDGAPPAAPVTEGGGLSNLRRRVEGEGGRMEVKSFPRFELRIEMGVMSRE